MEQSKEDNELNETGMKSYSYYEEAFNTIQRTTHRLEEEIVIPKKISYGDASFKNFDYREVFIDSKINGEYYIKLRNNNEKSIINAALFLANKLGIGCEVGVIDPGDNLHLDYHIYIKTNDEIIKEAMMSMMENIDGYISSKIKIVKK